MSEPIKQFLEDMHDVERYRAMEDRLNEITGNLMTLMEDECLGWSEEDYARTRTMLSVIRGKNYKIKDKWRSIFTNYSQIFASEQEVRVGGYVVEYASDYDVLVVLEEDDRICLLYTSPSPRDS